MAGSISVCLLIISANLGLGQLLFKPKLKFHPYETQTQEQSQCDKHTQELHALLESLIDAIKGDAELSKHPHLYNIIEHHLHRGEPTHYVKQPDLYDYDDESKYVSPYAIRPLLKQKFVSDNFVEESGEEDFPPTNEVVQQVFKDIKILFRRKSKKRIPVGEIEDILLRNLRPFIIFPIVKPCRQENVDNMLNFVRSAYLRFIETPCYDSIARNGNTYKTDEDRKLQESLREYIWQKRAQNRIPKSKSCKQRAFDYFLESIKIIVQLFIKNYDCHPQDDYNAPPVDEFDNIFTKNKYNTPRNYYREALVFPPFRSDSESQSKNNQPMFLNNFGPINYDDRKSGDMNSLYTNKSKVTVLNPIRDEKVNTIHLNDISYGDLFYPSLSKPNNNRNDKIPSAKDSVLIGPVRGDEEDLRNKVNTVHLNDGGYGDGHYPYYAMELNHNIKDNREYARIPNLVEFYKLIYGPNGIVKKQNNNRDNNLEPNFNNQQRNKVLNSDKFNDISNTMFLTKNTLHDAQKHDVIKDLTNIFDPNDMLMDLEDFRNSNNHFAAFGSLINRPSVELPSYDKSTNQSAEVEVVYVVRHPRVLVYNPQFVVKQRMTYETYMKNLKVIFNAKHFGPDNEIQLLKVLKRAANGEIIPLYQSKEKYEPLLLKDFVVVNGFVKEESQAKTTETPLRTPEPQTEKLPSAVVEDTAANVTSREAEAKHSKPLNVVANAKATSIAGDRNEDINGLKSAYEEGKHFVDETRTSSDQAPLAQLKAKKQVHYYDTPSYDKIVNTYKMNLDSEHALK